MHMMVVVCPSLPIVWFAETNPVIAGVVIKISNLVCWQIPVIAGVVTEILGLPADPVIAGVVTEILGLPTDPVIAGVVTEILGLPTHPVIAGVVTIIFGLQDHCYRVVTCCMTCGSLVTPITIAAALHNIHKAQHLFLLHTNHTMIAILNFLTSIKAFLKQLLFLTRTDSYFSCAII